MKRLLPFLILFLTISSLFAQNTESPADKSKRMAWWKDSKFGLFIHWGLYAVPAGEYKGQTGYGEWLMYEAKIPKPEYEALAPQFNPVQFDADAWVRMAKQAGMKYIVITSKHHDGFCMFDSKVSDYDIADRTPFRRDPLRELADACRKQGMKLCFYHSIMDWHHPDENKEHFDRYRDEYLLPQLKELLSNYGDIGVLWFDGEWIEEWTEEQGKALYNYVRQLQPNLIVNNRVGKGRNGMQGMNNSETAAGDFGTPEQEILEEKSTLDWESCMTMNEHWGYNKNDKNFKSAEDLIWNLIDVCAKGGNYLLNIGPTAEGPFPPESVERLKSIGDWMQVNGEAIYGSKPWTHWQEGDDIRYVQGQDGSVYVFLRGEAESLTTLKKIRPDSGTRIHVLGYEKDIFWKPVKDQFFMQLPGDLPKSPSHIRVLKIKGHPREISLAPVMGIEPGKALKQTVFAKEAKIYLYSSEPGAEIRYTTDGTDPNIHSQVYQRPIKINQSTLIRAIAKTPRKGISESVSLQAKKARMGIQLESKYADKYAAQGPLSLVDGQRGSLRFTDGQWLGFEGENFSAVLDLGSPKTLESLNISFLRLISSWIFLPTEIRIQGSNDGKQFTDACLKPIPAPKVQDANGIKDYRIFLPGTAHYRYWRVSAKNLGVCPSWHPGAGAKSWLFVDEISVQEAKTKGIPYNYDLLPRPSKLLKNKGAFKIDRDFLMVENPVYASVLFKRMEEKQLGRRSNSPKPNLPYITYQSVPSMASEAYSIDISSQRILIRAANANGFFYADQTLVQLWRLNMYSDFKSSFPCCHIEDAPRFAWRGMHLDESRHFMGKDFVLDFIDQLASLKMNVFHWHLTDAPGWRIEIKKYPKLTEIGAWRPNRDGILFGDADTAKVGEPMTYGGFYTQQDIREIVAYAAERHISILPEIEMPGHTTAALVAYPEFSCTGGPFPMPGGAKNCPYPNYCVGNEATMTFLKDILSEVMDLFPSTYIHIGGDEVERAQWTNCPRCQARKTALGLKDEAQLQVDFTKRIEDFIRSKGRRLMGWDEIMEGGNLTPSAGVMVWRGENLLREATAAGHEAVVTHNYYFDLYQGDPQYEPVTYGYKPLTDVYQYEPVPADLSPAQKKKILGVQGCLWTENIYSRDGAEYMLYPRLLALAEVAWTSPARKDWNDFKRRIPAQLRSLQSAEINYARSIYNPYPQVYFDSTSRKLMCKFEQQIPSGDIHFSADSSLLTQDAPFYEQPIELKEAVHLQAAAFQRETQISKTISLDFKPSLSSGKPFTLVHKPDPRYNGKHPEALMDGLTGSNDFHDGKWCGFYGEDLDLSIDLEQAQSLKNIQIKLMEANGSWIFLPESLSVTVSADGEHFETIYSATTAELKALNVQRIKSVVIPLQNHKARFVRIYAKNPGQHPVYPDGKCWIFVDEVRVE